MKAINRSASSKLWFEYHLRERYDQNRRPLATFFSKSRTPAVLKIPCSASGNLSFVQIISHAMGNPNIVNVKTNIDTGNDNMGIFTHSAIANLTVFHQVRSVQTHFCCSDVTFCENIPLGNLWNVPKLFFKVKAPASAPCALYVNLQYLHSNYLFNPFYWINDEVCGGIKMKILVKVLIQSVKSDFEISK